MKTLPLFIAFLFILIQPALLSQDRNNKKWDDRDKRDRIEILEERNSILEKRIQALEARLNMLENMLRDQRYLGRGERDERGRDYGRDDRRECRTLVITFTLVRQYDFDRLQARINELKPSNFVFWKAEDKQQKRDPVEVFSDIFSGREHKDRELFSGRIGYFESVEEALEFTHRLPGDIEYKVEAE